MIKNILNELNTLDNKVKSIMINGFKFSFLFTILSILILLFYKFYTFPVLYYCGTILFKTSVMFFVAFIVIGIGFDIIKKQMA